MRELLELAEDKGCYLLSYGKKNEDYIMLCLMQKWLREKHGVHVEACYNPYSELIYMYEYKINEKDIFFNSSDYFKTYEEALQKGLEEGLKLI